MKSANRDRSIPERVQAALLWDVPALRRGDGGMRQWERALNFDYLGVEPVDRDDSVSVAAHLVVATSQGADSRAIELRSELLELGLPGELLSSLIDLWLDVGDPSVDGTGLTSAIPVVEEVDDAELRARLLLRLAAFADWQGQLDVSARLLASAMELTDESDRLGVVARRRASGRGLDVPGFNPFSPTTTADDPLLTLPWIRSAALETAAALSASRLESELAGIWDQSVHWGRTRMDDLLACHAQAEWCGALDLRETLSRLVATHVLSAASGAEHERLAIKLWAQGPINKRVVAAIRKAEHSLDSAEAANLLDARGLNESRFQTYVNVASGVWDLLDDRAVESLLDALLEWHPDADDERAWNLVVTLLWRAPERWTDWFEKADPELKVAMLRRLEPFHVEAMPRRLQAGLADHPPAGIPIAVRAAIDFAREGNALESAFQFSPEQVSQLIDWRPASVASGALQEAVSEALHLAENEAEEARGGKWPVGGRDIRELLGRLASGLTERRGDVVDFLIASCEEPSSAAAWQLSALEGLASLGDRQLLSSQDIERVRALTLTPGRILFGEVVSEEVLRAAQLRVGDTDLTADDIGWLALHARSRIERARLVSMAALGSAKNREDDAIGWSLVSGLFDPSDDVVMRAVFGVSTSSLSIAVQNVVVARLDELFRASGVYVRREVVLACERQPALGLQSISDEARSDKSWIVRHEAAGST